MRVGDPLPLLLLLLMMMMMMMATVVAQTSTRFERK